MRLGKIRQIAHQPPDRYFDLVKSFA